MDPLVHTYLLGGANVDLHLIHGSLDPLTHPAKQHLYHVSRFSTIHARYQRTDQWTDRTNMELDR